MSGDSFTSIIGNCSYSEMAMVYLGVGNPTGLLLLRRALLAMVVWGTLQAVATVFNTADASMAFPTMIGERIRVPSVSIGGRTICH